ncbi:MAG: hypothetical protein JWN82_166, partial [Candidatus Saccharibacteria bacterium]|nr:hypothetical protein [Candidatus Saccharibacteria bacterium]
PALVIDGRSYDFGGPRYYNTAADTTAVEYTNGSGGGHTNTKPNLGAIKNPAAYSAFTYDTVTGEWQYSVFTVRPDASVSITPLVKLAVTDTAPPPLITADSDRDNTATKHTGTVIQHR